MAKFKPGARFKHKNNPIISELNSIGYHANNLHLLLKCAPCNAYKYMLQPDNLNLAQIKAISYAINKPLSYVLNHLLYTPSKSPNWLSDEYNPVEHISKLKQS